MASIAQPFFVIDPQTHKEANPVAISKSEPWAKELTCNIDGFALTESGHLVLFDNCGHLVYVPDGRFEVRQVLTGTPAEIGHCPFCGGRGMVKSELRGGYQDCPDDPDATAYYVQCISCATNGPWHKSESSAIRYWNMRVLMLADRTQP